MMMKMCEIPTVLILIAAFFNTVKGTEFLEEWLREQTADYTDSSYGVTTEDMGYATPGHAMEDEDYMTAFFANHNHKAFGENVENTGRRTDSEIDGHLADFFGIARTETDEPTQSIPDNYDQEDKAIKNDIVQGDNWKNYPELQEEDYEEEWGQAEDAYSKEENEMQSQNMEEDLEMWFQAMNKEDDDEVEDYEEKETSSLSDKLNVNFMDSFPEDAEIEATLEELDKSSECVKWKETIKRNHVTMRSVGMKLQGKLKEYAKAIENYETQNNVSCNKSCDMKCIPAITGYKCVESVNGTCTEKEEIINDCATEVRDPACEAEEADCQAKMKPVAEEVQRTKKEVDKAKKDMDQETRRIEMTMEEMPKNC